MPYQARFPQLLHNRQLNPSAQAARFPTTLKHDGRRRYPLTHYQHASHCCNTGLSDEGLAPPMFVIFEPWGNR